MKAPQPAPASITYEKVRDALVRMAEVYKVNWYAAHAVIDLLNGWDGGWSNKTLTDARKKLQQARGMTHHEMPTSAQASATRHQLERLVTDNVVEKQRGGGRSNNSWSYRWITQAMRDERAQRANTGATARDLARKLSLALGGDGESGVQPFLDPDNNPCVRVTLRGRTAERVLTALEASGHGPEFFKAGKTPYTGCTCADSYDNNCIVHGGDDA